MMSWSNWSNSSLHIAPLSMLHYILFLVCLLLLMVICSKIFYRYQGKSMVTATLLCVVNTFAVITMLLLILPLYQVKMDTEQAIVITNNSDEKLVQQAINRYQQGGFDKLYVWINDENERQALIPYLKQSKLFANVVWLTSSYQLLKHGQNHGQNFNELYVYGDGLTQQQFKSIEDDFSHVNLKYFPSQKVLGVVEAKWPQQVLLGASAAFEGKLQSNDSSVLYQVQLTDINQDVLAQQSVRASESFHFDFVPKAEGVNRYYLNIKELKSDNILAKETIQLNVVVGTPLNILVKIASPSFEVRHLKNWLAEQGSQLTVNSQTSKSAFLTQAVNNELESVSVLAINNADITSEYLASFDMLMLDGRTIITLKQAEQQAIVEAVKQGLALFVFVDGALIKTEKINPLTEYFQTFTTLNARANVSVNKSTVVHYNNNVNTALLLPSNISLLNTSGDILVTTDNKQPLLVSQSLGFGSVVLSTINTSYQWKLSGLNQDYGQYWQYIFGKIMTTKSEKYWLSTESNPLILPFNNVSLCYFSTVAGIKVQHFGLLNTHFKSPLTLAENKVIDREFHYCVDWFATQSGWHQFVLSTDEPNDNNADAQSLQSDVLKRVYVSEPEHWLAWQQTLKQKATQQRADFSKNNNSNDATFAGNTSNTVKRPMNKLPIWLVFISCCSILWIERKRA